ncbi:hypothetical protein LTR64_001296 [Lithohypha guttulata]|uniref:uncharacterized protein n=1 Tax=Lithohypha guttulata TaxID=1690604 RepID=UPI002DDE9BB5|nr:hypothetical protein LTR51_003490 [Lithohypha guttulata]
MTTYNIHFINKYSQAGSNQDYAIFSDLPKLSHNPSSSPLYSNVFRATSLTRGESWNIGISNRHYAWCGTVDRKLSAFAKVVVDSGKLAVLGTQAAPGSLIEVVNKNGRPSFTSKSALTSKSDSFALQTDPDVSLKSESVVGVATVDDEGNLRPLATMNAPFNATIDITPSGTFYIAAKSASAGTVIDPTTESHNAATINFAAYQGSYGAIVTHEANGDFAVEYVTQQAYNSAISMAQASGLDTETVPRVTEDVRDSEIAKLRQQIQQMQLLLDTQSRQEQHDPATETAAAQPSMQFPTIEDTPAKTVTSIANAPKSAVAATRPTTDVVADPYPCKQPTTWYKVTMPFRNSPGQSRRREIRDRLISLMQAIGYNYEGATIDNAMIALFSHNAGTYGNWHSVLKANEDWNEAYNSLSRSLRGFVGTAEELTVERVQESKGLWRARGETESRAKDTTEPTDRIAGTVASLGNTSSNSARPSAPNSSTSSKPLTNVVHHDRTHSKTTAKPVTNGVNGMHRDHSRASSRSASPVWTNGISTTTNGVQSHSHGRTSSKTTSKPPTNGVHIAPNGAIANGINGTTLNTTTKKYDYPRAEETAIEAAKRRARAVLEAEGLIELASGWKVSGR